MRREKRMFRVLVTALFAWSTLFRETAAFCPNPVKQPGSELIACHTTKNGSGEQKVVEVVLFGVGDLRVDDHLGLLSALQHEDQPILPLFLLDAAILANVPGAVTHTAETAAMLHEALADLDESLRKHWGMPLEVTKVGSSTGDALLGHVLKVCPTASEVRVHVCDLGLVDNEMGYGAFRQLSLALQDSMDGRQLPITVVPWTQNLRKEPWKAIESKDGFPLLYPDFRAKYAGVPVILPVDTMTGSRKDASQLTNSLNEIPSRETLRDLLTETLQLDPAVVEAQMETGLYATHWGGLDATSVRESSVLPVLDTYTSQCNEDDKVWEHHPSFIDRRCRRKGASLEHAAMLWQLRGDGTKPAGNADNWMAGESMVRFLAAPLLFGTVSPRRVWHSSKTTPQLSFVPALKRMTEGREWHRLLASHQLIHGMNRDTETGTSYKYWRYHGFLCRYAETSLSDETLESSADSLKEGVLLVHGFGASGGQWNKAMKELRKEFSAKTDGAAMREGLAPDLLGFGQSEKPGISYTGYLWDAMVQEFVKEVAIKRNGWSSYIVGGNSIGGFTSMSLAASEMAQLASKQVSASGAPGTSRCTGLVLMNSAGPVMSAEEVAQATENAQGNPYKLESVAQTTASDALPPCKPPPRPVSRLFGHGLMTYLRPSIGKICANLYPTNPAAVDETLCNGILRDSLDPGAVHVMMAGAKLPPPRSANELLAADFGAAPSDPNGSLPESVFDGPVLIAQGVLDPLNDAMDRMKRFGALRDGVTMDPIQAGHCPHDEVPDQVAASIAQWMNETVRVRQARLTSTTPGRAAIGSS